MAARRHYANGPAGEGLAVYVGSGRVLRGAIPVVFCHGFFGSSFTSPWQVDERPFTALADAGYPVLYADLGGGSTWGSDTVVAPGTGRIDTVIAWAGAQLGTRTDRVVIAGESMGSMNAMGWAWRQPWRVAAAWFRGVLPDADELHDTNYALGAAMNNVYPSGGLTLDIWDGGTPSTVYSNTLDGGGPEGVPDSVGGADVWGDESAGWEAAKPQRDPAYWHHVLRAFAQRTRWDHARDDDIIPAPTVQAAARSIGITELVWRDGNHVDTLNAGGPEVAAWLRSVGVIGGT